MLVSFEASKKCRLDFEASDIKQAFQFIAYAESVFGVDTCGKCGESNLKLMHRTPQGYDYHSVACQDCGYELKFGQVKETGHLFQKGWEPPYSDDGDSGSTDDAVQPDSQEYSAGEPATVSSTF